MFDYSGYDPIQVKKRGTNSPMLVTTNQQSLISDDSMQDQVDYDYQVLQQAHIAEIPLNPENLSFETPAEELNPKDPV